jgi:hypothetical protein
LKVDIALNFSLRKSTNLNTHSGKNNFPNLYIKHLINFEQQFFVFASCDRKTGVVTHNTTVGNIFVNFRKMVHINDIRSADFEKNRFIKNGI